MVHFKSALLALLPLLAIGARAEIDAVWEELTEEEAATLTGQPVGSVAVDVQTTFPNSEFLGVKLVNNHATQAILSFTNQESSPVRVQIVGASLQDPQTEIAVRNFTATSYNVEIPSGGQQSLTYNFATELHPQDVRLLIAAVVTKGEIGFQLIAYNGTVSVVDAPISIFDPQMIFLYLFLSACFAGTCYFIYTTWIATLFPQKKPHRGGKGTKASKGSKAVDSADQIAVGGADGPAVASGAKAIDESWIPAQHLKRPEAKRVSSGKNATPKSRAK